MKRLLFIPLIILLGVTAISCNQNTKEGSEEEAPSAIARRVVIIGLDGFSIDGFKTAKHPNLDSLFADGILSLNSRCVMPSVTLPNWTSHLTASGPEQHGVDGNGWNLDKHNLPGLETDSDGYYPSIFKVLKDKVPGMKTAYYYNWANLIKPINKKYLDEISYLENDEYLENYDKALKFAESNKDNPTLIFLYSVHTDHAGHRHNWMSPEYITAIEEADVAIGDLIDKFKKAGIYDDTHFMLITDHGGIGNGHGGTTTDEMIVPWAIKGPGILKNNDLQKPNNNTNTANVVAELFNVKELPEPWIGFTPDSIFDPTYKN